MKQGFKECVCAVVLCAELFAAGALSAYAAQEQPLPDSGMTLDTAELTLDITEGDPAPVAYLNVQAPNDYFFLIWTSSDPAVASVEMCIRDRRECSENLHGRKPQVSGGRFVRSRSVGS